MQTAYLLALISKKALNMKTSEYGFTFSFDWIKSGILYAEFSTKPFHYLAEEKFLIKLINLNVYQFDNPHFASAEI